MPPAFYPRLHRLSVLNIIYHGNFDYPLNPWCTSFAGDSGVGKSLIADLLQLIFVGKGEYKSATKGQDARPPEGLVLADVATGGKGLGYAFLSVETGPAQFLVVGCYLAAATGAVVPFVVQQGISFSEELVPLTRPLGYRDLLPADGRILPLADMATHIRLQLGATSKFFERQSSEFHRVLWDNQLLPLDVNRPGVLKSYATIIQSFSRGIDFDYHQKPDKLKKFLFGEEAQQDILRDYERRTDDIRQQLVDYQENGKQATLLQEKLVRFNRLHQQHQAWQHTRRELLRDQLAYWQTEALRAEDEARQLADRLQRGETAHRQLRLTKCQAEAAEAAQTRKQHADLVEKQQRLTSELAGHQQTEQTAQQQADTVRPAAEQARRYEEVKRQLAGWLATYNTVAGLRRAQEQQQQQRREQGLLSQLEAHLHGSELHTFFPQSVWAQGNPQAAEAALNALREAAAASRREQLFTNLDNPDSLARWALQRGQPLTLDEESILAHFGQQAAWREQEAGYYLHTPDELFAAPLEVVAGSHNAGFWLHLRGVRLWIPRLAEADQAFADADKTRVRRLFAARQKAARQRLAAQTDRLTQEEALTATWPRLPEWPAALAAWPRRAAIRQGAAETLPASEVLNELLALAETDALGQAAHAQADRQAAEAATALKKAQNDLAVNDSQRQQTATDLAALPATDAAAETRTEAAARQAAQELTDWQQVNALEADALPYQEAELAALRHDTYKLGEAAANQQKDLTAARVQLEQATARAQECRASYARCHAHYAALTDQAAPAAPAGPPYPVLPEPDPAAAATAQRAYETEFDQLRAALATGLAERPVYEDGPALLMRELLPEVLHGVVESEEALRLVEEKLHSINENNRLIARLKMELLRAVFDRVSAYYYAYVEETKRIRRYFLERKVQITGGFKPELKYERVPDYPLEWMEVFGQLLREQASHPVQFAHLSEAESLEELMCRAFRLQGGALPQPRVADLLNPRSYLHVEFGMGSATVKANKGSTGQTFMAVALLNIARLSIIAGGEQRPGIRFMPVDEAAGLGSNYAVLLELARDKSYQVISLSPEPIMDEASVEHRVYFLAFDPAAVALNLHPMMLTTQQKLVPVPAPLLFADSLFADAPDQPTAAE